MKLFFHPLCPFVQRVVIGLEERGLQNLVSYEPVSLSNPPAALLQVNASGSVPTLLFGPSDGISESLIILEFLDSLPSEGPKLFGSTPKEIAKIKVLLENLNSNLISVLQLVSYAFGKMDQVVAAIPKVKKGLAFLNDILIKNKLLFTRIIDDKKSVYLGGHSPNVLDVALAPFLINFLDLIESFSGKEVLLNQKDFSIAEFPLIVSYVSLIRDRWANFSPILSQVSVDHSKAEYLEIKFSQFKGTDAGSSVRKANRDLLLTADLENTVKKEMAALSKDQPNVQKMVSQSSFWEVGQSEKGNHLEAIFNWQDWETGIKVSQTILNLQENADHHSDFKLTQNHLYVRVCTHEPHWGVSHKDLAFAQILTQLLFKIS